MPVVYLSPFVQETTTARGGPYSAIFWVSQNGPFSRGVMFDIFFTVSSCDTGESAELPNCAIQIQITKRVVCFLFR